MVMGPGSTVVLDQNNYAVGQMKYCPARWACEENACTCSLTSSKQINPIYCVSNRTELPWGSELGKVLNIPYLLQKATKFGWSFG